MLENNKLTLADVINKYQLEVQYSDIDRGEIETLLTMPDSYVQRIAKRYHTEVSKSMLEGIYRAKLTKNKLSHKVCYEAYICAILLGIDSALELCIYLIVILNYTDKYNEVPGAFIIFTKLFPKGFYTNTTCAMLASCIRTDHRVAYNYFLKG